MTPSPMRASSAWTSTWVSTTGIRLAATGRPSSRIQGRSTPSTSR
ncbi:MAG: hypothetical protein ACXWJA_01865 [Caldimonas sp.]